MAQWNHANAERCPRGSDFADRRAGTWPQRSGEQAMNCQVRLRVARLGFALAMLFSILVSRCVGQTENGYEKAKATFQSGQYLEAVSLFEAVESAEPGKTDALL